MTDFPTKSCAKTFSNTSNYTVLDYEFPNDPFNRITDIVCYEAWFFGKRFYPNIRVYNNWQEFAKYLRDATACGYRSSVGPIGCFSLFLYHETIDTFDFEIETGKLRLVIVFENVPSYVASEVRLNFKVTYTKGAIVDHRINATNFSNTSISPTPENANFKNSVHITSDCPVIMWGYQGRIEPGEPQDYLYRPNLYATGISYIPNAAPNTIAYKPFLRPLQLTAFTIDDPRGVIPEAPQALAGLIQDAIVQVYGLCGDTYVRLYASRHNLWPVYGALGLTIYTGFYPESQPVCGLQKLHFVTSETPIFEKVSSMPTGQGTSSFDFKKSYCLTVHLNQIPQELYNGIALCSDRKTVVKVIKPN